MDKDVFKGAQVALAWIETATLEDCRAFIKDPKKFPRIYFAGFDDDFQKAFLDAFMEHWLTLAPDDIAMIEKNESEFRDLFPAAARAMPALLLSKLSPDGKKSPYDDWAPTAFEALAAHDARAARRILETLNDSKNKRDYEFAILKGIAKNDPLAADALLPAAEPKGDKPDYSRNAAIDNIVEAAERIGLGTLRQLFATEGAKYDGYFGLSRLLLRYPDLAADLAARSGSLADSRSYQVTENLIRDADQTPAETRAKILADYDNLPTAGRDALCAALVAAWARTEPRAAAEWALAHVNPDAPKSRAPEYAFLRWVASDSRAAFAWWQSLPPSALRDGIGLEASTRFAEDGDFDTAKQLARNVPSEGYEQASSHFALLYAKHDPAGAAAWLQSLTDFKFPPYNQYPNPVPSIVGRYFTRDPEGAARWVDSLPAGTLREQSLAHAAAKIAQTNPAAAAEWVVKISDPTIRTSAAQWVVNPWKAGDPIAARAWVEAQSRLDEKFRNEFLNQ